MRATRQVLAVVAVTTALCADRVAQAAPASRPTARPVVAQIAGRLMVRLANSFRRVVASVAPWQLRQRSVGAGVRAAWPAPARAFVAHRPVSPFQFRLPPPTA